MDGDGQALLYPLDDFYSSAGVSLPKSRQVEPEGVPQPYHKLLVHSGDMTPALEGFYDQTIGLEVLRTRHDKGRYLREVVLILDGTQRRVEYGAIAINLALFPAKAQEEILSGRRPLGTLMHEQHVRHSSRPRAYLSIESDAHIGRALRLKTSTTLYGRRNTLYTPQGESLAEIVEILAPA